MGFIFLTLDSFLGVLIVTLDCFRGVALVAIFVAVGFGFSALDFF